MPPISLTKNHYKLLSNYTSDISKAALIGLFFPGTSNYQLITLVTTFKITIALLFLYFALLFNQEGDQP